MDARGNTGGGQQPAAGATATGYYVQSFLMRSTMRMEMATME